MQGDDTHKPVIAKARCSVTPSHRLKYFNHKIILASIEPRGGARCARQDRLAERTGSERLTLLHKRIQLLRPRAPPRTFSATRESDVLTCGREIL